MATHSSTVAWKIPWTEEPGGLQSMGSQILALFDISSISSVFYSVPPRVTFSKTWVVLGAVWAVSFETKVSLRLRFLYLLAEGFPEGKGRRKMQRLAGTVPPGGEKSLPSLQGPSRDRVPFPGHPQQSP